MARFRSVFAFYSAALLLSTAAPAADPPLVRGDVQAAAEQEGYAAFLYRDVATHAREDGFAMLAGLLEDLATRNAQRARAHRQSLASDRLVDDLRAVAGVAIAQHQAYGRALQHARAVGDRDAAAQFETLFVESGRDRDALQASIDARISR